MLRSDEVILWENFVGFLDASIELLHLRANSPSAPLRRHNRTRSGVLMYLSLPDSAPSAFELSQLSDGLFPRPRYLSCFIQMPPMGFKERWRLGLRQC